MSGERASGSRSAAESEPRPRRQAFSAFDIVIASGVLHHLDDDEALRLFRIAHDSLKDGGRLVTLDGCYADGQGRLARFLLSRDRGNHVRSRDGYIGLASQVFRDVDAIIKDGLLRIPYTHLILVCTRAGGAAPGV